MTTCTSTHFHMSVHEGKPDARHIARHPVLNTTLRSNRGSHRIQELIASVALDFHPAHSHRQSDRASGAQEPK